LVQRAHNLVLRAIGKCRFAAVLPEYQKGDIFDEIMHLPWIDSISDCRKQSAKISSTARAHLAVEIPMRGCPPRPIINSNAALFARAAAAAVYTLLHWVEFG